MRRDLIVVGGLLVGLLAPTEADAQTSPLPEPSPDAETEDRDTQKRSKAPRLEFVGRVFVRDTLSRVSAGDTSVARHERAIDQARAAVDYRKKRLRLSLEVDFSDGDADLKDTFIRLGIIDELKVTAGRFKRPMSFIGLESKWRLAAVERGLLSELRQDDRELPFAGGRGDGVMVELELDHAPLEPSFTVASLQTPTAAGFGSLDPRDDLTQDLFARAEVELGDVHLAAAYGLVGYLSQLTSPDSFEHRSVGSLEVHLRHKRIRAWLEGFTGQSIMYRLDGTLAGSFQAARMLVAPRFKRPWPGLRLLEPYVGGSLLEPSSRADQDRVAEAVLGTSLGFTKTWRVQVELAQRAAQDNAPVADSTLFRVQLGASFEH